MHIIAYEMKLDKEVSETVNIQPIPFQKEYFQEYMTIYNECFYDMRKALDIQPYSYLQAYEQIEDKVKEIYLWIRDGELIGSVACYGNEIDDLVVNRKFQRQGYGKQLLLWGIRHIRERSNEPIVLHVAEWNQTAVRLYQKVGFEISKVERVS